MSAEKSGKLDAIEIAKNITIAHVPSMPCELNAESGKKVAEYFNAVYNGIAETIVNVKALDKS